MKMDRELLRLLLLEIEKRDEPFVADEIEIEGHDSGRIAHHCSLLDDAGLIVGSESSTLAGPRFLVERLTFAGHEFLEAVRGRSTWRAALDRIDRGGGGFVLSVVKDLAVSILRQRTGLDP